MADPCDNNPQLQSSLNRAAGDKFILVLDLPKVLKKQALTDPALDMEYLQLGVHGSIVPAINVPAIDLGFGGQHANVSSYARPNYPPLVVNFMIDNSYKNYYILWKWLNVLNDARESVYGGTPIAQESIKDQLEDGLNTEYQTTFSILGLNEYNKSVVEFTYYNAFITNLGGINYSYRDPNQLESTAEFQFNQLDVALKIP